MNDRLTIACHIPIEHASKTIDFETDEPYDSSNDKHASEWALAVALSTYKIGETTTLEEFKERVFHAKLQQDLDRMCELGLIEAVWNEKTCEIGYKAK